MRTARRRPFLARVTLVVTSTVIASSFVAPAFATTNDDGTVTVSISAITDLHGHLENAPNLAYQVEQIRENNPDSLFLANGDSVGASAYISSVDQDNPTMDILNAMGVDASATGNHELDQGYDDLAGRINSRVDFPYLAANLIGADPESTPPYVVLETPSGVSVGVIGTETRELKSVVAAESIVGLDVTDPVEAVDRYAALLKDGDAANGEADVVVALVHDDLSVASQLGPDVDAAVSGHTHMDKQGTTASGAPVIEPGRFGDALATFTITVDPATGEVISREGTVSEVADIEASPEAPIDETVMGMYEQAKATADEKGTVLVGQIEGPVSVSDVESIEATAPNFLANAYYEWGAEYGLEPDFSIQNAGGTRSDVDTDANGEITVAESQTSQPFGNTMVKVDVTAAQVYELFEDQFKDDGFVDPLGLSDNVSYSYDPTAPLGERIRSITIDGLPVERDSDTTYRVVTSSYLAGSAAGLVDGTGLQDTGIIDAGAFNDYMEANSPVVVNQGQRGIGVVLPETITAGEEATIALSSLSMADGVERPTEIVLSDETGMAIGSATIDPTVNEEEPSETGTASVTFTLPADYAAGEHIVTAMSGDTVVSFPITVEAGAAAQEPTGGQPGEEPTGGEPSEEPTGEEPTGGQPSEEPSAEPGDSAGADRSPSERPSSTTPTRTAPSTRGAQVLAHTGVEAGAAGLVALALTAAGAVMLHRGRSARR